MKQELKWYRSPNPKRPNDLEAYDPILKGVVFVRIGWPIDLTKKNYLEWKANGKQGTFGRQGQIRVPDRTDNSPRTTQGKLGAEADKQRHGRGP